MENVVDVVRMQLLSTANAKRNQWQYLILIAILGNYKRLWEQVLTQLSKVFTHKIFKRLLKPPAKKLIKKKPEKTKEIQPKTLIKLRFNKGDLDNRILKEILNKHAVEFDIVSLKGPNSWHVISPKTITLAEDIFFHLDFTERPKPIVQKKQKKRKNEDDSDCESESDEDEAEEAPPSTTNSNGMEYELHETRGQVYSFEKPLKEVLDFLHATYVPPEPKATAVKVIQPAKKILLHQMVVGRTVKYDDKGELRGEILEFTVSKSLNNIFLEPDTRELLLSQVSRFNDPNWYAERGLPRTLGVLLHGQPGCGKTSFIKSLCAHLKRKVLIVDFKLVKTVSHLRKIFAGNFVQDNEDATVHRFTKDNTIYVFEDFDCMSSVFLDRNLKQETDKKEEEEAKKEAEFEREMIKLTRLENIEKLKAKNNKKRKPSRIFEITEDLKKVPQKKGKKGKKDPEEDGKKPDAESGEKEEGKVEKKKHKKVDSDSSSEEETMPVDLFDIDHSKHSEFPLLAEYADDGWGGAWGLAKYGGYGSTNKWSVNARNEQRVSLADFLELLDGIIEMDGRIIIMTTNQRDKLDSALVRPGRIDLDLELCPPSKALIVDIYLHMYKHIDASILEETMEKYFDEIQDSKVSTARVINCFMLTKPENGIRALIESAKSPDGKEVDFTSLFKTTAVIGSFRQVWDSAIGKVTEASVAKEPANEVVDIYKTIFDSRSLSTEITSRGGGGHSYTLLDINSKENFIETSYECNDEQSFTYLFNNYKIRMHQYTIVRTASACFRLLNWNIEAANNKTDWVVISTHRDDYSLVKEKSATFQVECAEFYRNYRIRSVGPSWNARGATNKCHFDLNTWQIMGEIIRD